MPFSSLRTCLAPSRCTTISGIAASTIVLSRWWNTLCIVTTTREGERHLLAEDALLTAFTGDPSAPQWLPEADAEKLMAVKPDASVPPDIAIHQLVSVTDHLPGLIPVLDEFATKRGQELLEAHRRVRKAADARGSYRIDHSPPDVLGIYIFLPVAKL